MIERQKARYGWEFLFLGANIDAVDTAAISASAPTAPPTSTATRAERNSTMRR